MKPANGGYAWDEGSSGQRTYQPFTPSTQSGYNSHGNNWVLNGAPRGDYAYDNRDGSTYQNHGVYQGAAYDNPNKGYQWDATPSGERTYRSSHTGDKWN